MSVEEYMTKIINRLAASSDILKVPWGTIYDFRDGILCFFVMAIIRKIQSENQISSRFRYSVILSRLKCVTE